MFTSQHKWLYDALLPRSILLYSFGHLWSSSSFHSYLLMSTSQKPHVHFLKIVSQSIHNALFLHNNTFNFLLALSASSTLWQSDAVLHEPCSCRLTCSKPIKRLQNTPIYTAVSRNDFSIVHKVTAWIPYLKTTQPLLGLCDFRNPKCQDPWRWWEQPAAPLVSQHCHGVTPSYLQAFCHPSAKFLLLPHQFPGTGAVCRSGTLWDVKEEKAPDTSHGEQRSLPTCRISAELTGQQLHVPCSLQVTKHFQKKPPAEDLQHEAKKQTYKAPCHQPQAHLCSPQPRPPGGHGPPSRASPWNST